MKRRFSFLGVMILIVSMLSACGSKIPFFQGPRYSFGDPNVSKEGPTPLINEAFEDIDLVCLLKTNNRLENNIKCSEIERGYFGEEYGNNYRRELQKAINDFYNKPPDDQIGRRNGIQDHIIAASNQRCGQYKQFLKNYNDEGNLLLGWLTTGTAGLGAVFTAADTVRALAGTAAILSGWRAEFNEVLFQQRTMQALTNGFEAKRSEIYRKILENRTVQHENAPSTDKDLKGYSIERAIGEAIQYHDNCSLIAGLEFAALSIERSKDPGLNHLAVAFKSFRKAQEEATKIAERSESGAASNVAFPLTAFTIAEEAKTQLTAVSATLKQNDPTNFPVPPNEVDKAKLENAKKHWTSLTGEITALLEEANGALTPAAKIEATTTQNDLSQKFAQIYANAADPANAAKLAGAHAEYGVVLGKAKGLEEKYNSLARRMKGKTDEAQRLIADIEGLK